MAITLNKLSASYHSVKVSDGTNDLLIDGSGHISINDGGNVITIDGTLTGITNDVNIADGGNVISIDDAGGSITVDGTVAIGSQAFVYAEDTAHVTADEGAFMLAVRADSKASTAGTDGDYAALIQDADGDLYVSDTVAQGSLSTLAGAVAGSEMQVDVLTMPGIQTEDAASAGGESLMMVGGYRQDAETSPVSADGDFHGFIFNATGELKTSSRLDDVANTSITVTNTVVDNTVGGVQLLASQVSGRKDYTIQNLSNLSIWVKDATGVTSGATGNGFEIPAGSALEKKWGDSFDLYAIGATAASLDIKMIEAA